MEFDYETSLVSEFPEPTNEKEFLELKAKTLNFEFADTADRLKKQGDVTFPCMKFASIFRKSPKEIAWRLKSYLEWFDFIDRVEITGGYMNIYYNRGKFFKSVIERISIL